MFNASSNRSLWDQKAKQYPRFSSNPTEFQQRIFQSLAQSGIDFEGKTLLDVGCGTGVYTLHFAHKALHVSALDLSLEMLNVLKKDAEQQNLRNTFDFFCGTWDDFQTDRTFDICFSSMSPALQTPEHIERFNALSSHACAYLGWAGKRISGLLDPVFQAHGLTLKVPLGAELILQWLEQNRIAFDERYLEDTRLHVIPYAEALESALWHLHINRVQPNMPALESMIASMQDANGNVAFETTSGVKLISWKK